MSTSIKRDTREVIAKFGCSIYDTGSSEVQIAILSTRIFYLQNHFMQHKKDYHSRRGLLRMVAKRRKLLNYLKSQDSNRYISLIGKLGLRR